MAPPPEGSEARVRAWDAPTRLFHWLLVVCIASAWLSYRYAEVIGDPLLKWHRWNGLAVLTLIVWRVLWGLFGSSTSRFATFVPTPRTALSYAGNLLMGRTPRYLGHNPLGSLMVLALLAALTLQATLGLFAVDENDLTGGPLYRLVSEGANKALTLWHARTFWYGILVLAAIHVATNVLYSLIKREPLITAMITGTKPAADYEDAPSADIPPRPLLRAGMVLFAAAFLVVALIKLLGGRLP